MIRFLIPFLFAFSTYAAPQIKLPVPELETLPNGLQIVWFTNDKLPIVDLVVLVKSGYRDEDIGKSGTTELLEASMDRGAGGKSAQEIARAIEALGASRYANADEDTISIGMHGLAPDAETLLDLLSKIVIHPDFPEMEVKREHARLLDRWSHVADYGESLVSLAYNRLMTAGTSYGRGGFTSVKEFSKVSRSDILEYHKKHFTPKNSVLMVVGRVDRLKFKEKVLTSFGSWQGEAPEHKYKNHTDSRLAKRGGEILIVDRPNLTQAQVRLGFRAPSIHAPEHYSLVVANTLLGEYFNSRLNSLIRDKLGLTYAIGSAFSYNKDLGVFTVSSASRNENVGQLLRKTLDVLKDLKKGPIPKEEVNMAKEYLIGGFPLATSTLSSVASRWLGGFIFNLGPEYLNEFVPRVEGVSVQDVLSAVNKDFTLDRMTIVVAGDAKEIEKGLRTSKFTSFRRVSIQDLL